MKFSIAAAAIAATSSFVGVHASTSTSKSGKGSCSSSPKLEKFCAEEAADFGGRYKVCYTNVVREAADLPRYNGAYHLCPNGEGDSLEVFKPLDEFGAYESTLVLDSILAGGGGGDGDGSISFTYQGIAQGNSIKMTSFGEGTTDSTGAVIRQNETPDTEECTLYDGGILKCIAQQNEYCGASDNSQGPSIGCEIGTWLHSYTIETISALEGSECPEAPVGFCDSGTPIPVGGRKLQEEEEEEEEEEEDKASPCPFFNKNMN